MVVISKCSITKLWLARERASVATWRSHLSIERERCEMAVTSQRRRREAEGGRRKNRGRNTAQLRAAQLRPHTCSSARWPQTVDSSRPRIKRRPCPRTSHAHVDQTKEPALRLNRAPPYDRSVVGATDARPVTKGRPRSENGRRDQHVLHALGPMYVCALR